MVCNELHQCVASTCASIISGVASNIDNKYCKTTCSHITDTICPCSPHTQHAQRSSLNTQPQLPKTLCRMSTSYGIRDHNAACTTVTHTTGNAPAPTIASFSSSVKSPSGPTNSTPRASPCGRSIEPNTESTGGAPPVASNAKVGCCVSVVSNVSMDAGSSIRMPCTRRLCFAAATASRCHRCTRPPLGVARVRLVGCTSVGMMGHV